MMTRGAHRPSSDSMVGEVWKLYDRSLIEAADPSTLMSPVELEALRRASRHGAEYLSSIAKSDMKTLTMDEWKIFCSKLVLGYECELIGILSDKTG